MIISPMHAFWDRPTPATMGEDDPNKIFLAVGGALTTWEGVEESFCSLLAILVGSKSPSLPRIYGTMISSSARIEAIKAAGEVLFDLHPDTAAKEKFELLIKHFQKAATARNEIAHGRVCKFTLNGTHYKYFLVAPGYLTRKTEPTTAFFRPDVQEKYAVDNLAGINSTYRYISSDIAHYNEKFKTLSDWAADYYFVLEPIRQSIGWH